MSMLPPNLGPQISSAVTGNPPASAGAAPAADTLPPGATDAQIRDFVERHYGFMGWALDHPELGPLLFQAAREGWDEHRLKGAVEATVWFRNNSVTQRAYDEEEATDPASAKRKVEAQAAQIIESAKKLGVNITPERASQLAREVIRNGMGEAEVTAAIRKEFRYKPESTVDKETGRLAFVGPNGEPGWDPNDPNKPADAVEHTMADGRKVAYRPNDFDPTDNMANSGGLPELLAAQKEQVGRGVVLAPGTVFAPNPGGKDVLIDVRTGRPAFRGPNGEQGFDPRDPNVPEGAEVWVAPDGREVAFVRSKGQKREVETVTEPLNANAQTLEQELRDIVKSYELPFPETEFARWVTQIIRGESTIEQFKNLMRADAMRAWPQFAAAIQDGQTTRQFLANYGGVVEQVLGIPYEQISWGDTKWKRALFQQDEKTGSFRAMDLFDWEQMLKTNDEYGWSATPKGRDEWASFGSAFNRMFKGVE